MGLAEVVFEAEVPSVLTRFTKEHADTRAVVRLVQVRPQLRAIVTLAGTADVTSTWVRALREETPGEFEIVSVTPYSVVLRLGPVGSPAWAEPARRLLDVFGTDTVLEPMVAEEGRLRVKAMAPQQMDTRQALEKLSELQRATGWDGFRVVRVGEFDPKLLVERSAPLLEPEQEELVRLALVMGYYDTPRRCNLEDIAQRVGLSVSPVHKKLKEVEHTLIHAFLDPTAPRPPRRRRQGRSQQRSAPGSAMREVVVRFVPPSFLPSRFTREHAQARLVYQALGEDPAEQRQLLVLLAGPADAQDFLARLGADPMLLDHQVLSRDDAHVSVRVRRRAGEPDPLAQLAAALGRDAYPKPAVVERGTVLGRVVVMRRIGEEELAVVLEELASQNGWRDAELVAVKDVGVEGALLARPRAERMTARQEEVLRIAQAMGYYRTPRGCTLESIAGTLGISANAVHKNLTAAEQRIIQDHVTAAL